MSSLNATILSPILNGYTISEGPPRSIMIHNASKAKLATLQDITVCGKLLGKQFVTLNKNTNQRQVVSPKGGSVYSTSPDGDVHLCLGYQLKKPHIASEVQNAKAFVSKFNQSIGKPITVS